MDLESSAPTPEGTACHSASAVAMGKKIDVYLLPSLPLTNKHKAPAISGIGIIYSEELDRVLQVFQTDNLREEIKGFSRDQAAALNVDPGCRLHWLELSNPVNRAEAMLRLLSQIRL